MGEKILQPISTVDSRYLESDGTMEKIRVNRSSTQEELLKYRKCSLFNDEREMVDGAVTIVSCFKFKEVFFFGFKEFK
jgi:hypothetical protein